MDQGKIGDPYDIRGTQASINDDEEKEEEDNEVIIGGSGSSTGVG